MSRLKWETKKLSEESEWDTYLLNQTVDFYDSCLRLPLLLLPVVYLADPFHDDSTGRRFLGNVDVLHAVIFFVLN